MTDLLHQLVTTYANAYIAALLIALGGSVLGVYVLLRRVAFVGVATAELATAGVAFAFLVHLPPLPAAVITALLGLSLFAMGRDPVRVSRDGLLGVAFAVSSALAVLFVARSGAELDQVEHIVYGSLLFTTGHDVTVLAIGVGVVLVIHALFARPFVITAFDPETARTLGVRTGVFDLLFFLTLGLVVALSIRTAGSLLAFAFLLLPPAAGLLLGRGLRVAFVVSALLGVLSAVLGVLLSVLLDLPTGPSIVVTAGGILAVVAAGVRHRLLGAAVLIALLVPTSLMIKERIDSRAHPVAVENAPALHIDVELAPHPPRVKEGGTLHVDVIARIQGTPPKRLFLLVELGEVVESVELPVLRDRASTALAIDMDGVPPGHYALTGSLYTGPPLEPDVDTELLAPEQFSIAGAAVEVTGR